MKLGALGIPAYHTFSLEELEEATNNFDTSAFMGEGSQGQVYQSGVNIYLFFFFFGICNGPISFKDEYSFILSLFTADISFQVHPESNFLDFLCIAYFEFPFFIFKSLHNISMLSDVQGPT